MRRAAKKDKNQALIVSALRQAGASVAILNETDLPDLLVGYRGEDYLIEIKDGRRVPSQRRLRPGQQRFFAEWKGKPPVKAETMGDAFRALGINLETGD